MSLYDYRVGRQLRGKPFYALLMAAFAEADESNFEKLKAAFPEVYAEVDVRYHAPGGLLLGEHDAQSGLRRTADGFVDDDGVLVRKH